MLQPKRTKYRKQFRGRRKGVAKRGFTLSFGEYGLKAAGNGWVKAREIESARRAISHYTKRGGKVWIRVFPHKPVTKKPLEVRMGGGKGDVDHYVAVVKRGLVLFEISGVTEVEAKEAFRLAAHKLSIATRFASKV